MCEPLPPLRFPLPRAVAPLESPVWRAEDFAPPPEEPAPSDPWWDL